MHRIRISLVFKQKMRIYWYKKRTSDDLSLSVIQALTEMGKLRLPARNPAPLATPEGLNQRWSIDFMHNALVCGRRFRTFNVVDDFNREVLSIEIDQNIPAQRVVRVRNRIVAARGYPLKLRMYNGPELISLTLAQ